jgi:hypothetical protein
MKTSAAILATFLAAQPVAAHAAWVCPLVSGGFVQDITGIYHFVPGFPHCDKWVWDPSVSQKEVDSGHAAWERQQRENDRIQKDNFDNCCGKGRSYGHDFGQPTPR